MGRVEKLSELYCKPTLIKQIDFFFTFIAIQSHETCTTEKYKIYVINWKLVSKAKLVSGDQRRKPDEIVSAK